MRSTASTGTPPLMSGPAEGSGYVLQHITHNPSRSLSATEKRADHAAQLEPGRG
jgi:hypothetical protein